MIYKQCSRLVLVVLVGLFLLTACGGEEKVVEVTRVVTEKETVVETVVEKVVETVVEKETVVEAVVEPMSTRPEVFIELEGEGEKVTDKYEFAPCEKAVFYWTAKPDASRAAALHVDLYPMEGDREVSLAAVTEVNAYEIIEGSLLHPLAGGEYYFKIWDTDEAWTVRGECQDGQAPAGARLFLAGTAPMVTKNYSLPQCEQSAFIWTIDPDDEGVVSLVADLHMVGEEPSENLVNNAEARVEEMVKGEALHALDAGVYFITVEQVRGAWTLRWKCQD